MKDVDSNSTVSSNNFIVKYTKEILYELIIVKNLSYAEIGRMYNMSGAGIKKSAKRFNIDLPIRSILDSNSNFKKSTYLCKYCGKQCSENRKTYCSIDCYKLSIKKNNHLKIKNGVILSPKLSKKYLIDIYGEKCQQCNWEEKNPITGKVPIELEHIDGDSTNNSIDNLKLLCPNCHSLTTTYKGLNKGNGRYKRKQRYKEGKSY